MRIMFIFTMIAFIVLTIVCGCTPSRYYLDANGGCHDRESNHEFVTPSRCQ